jgi:hypothetical protein
MALVVITLVDDTEDGTVDMKVISEPRFNKDTLTDAQTFALVMLDSVAGDEGVADVHSFDIT